jgi:hypothetical protein
LLLRARTLARIADALWEINPDGGRDLFRRAYQAGLAADEDSKRKLQAEVRRHEAQGDSWVSTLPPESLEEILTLVDRRDPVLKRELEKQLPDANVTDRGNVDIGDLGDILDSFNRPEGIYRFFPTEPSEEDLLDRISHSSSSTERDGLYFDLTFRAVRTLDLKARDYVNKIEEPELRKELRAFVDAVLMIGAIVKKQTEKALRLAQAGELTHLQRAWAFARAGGLLSKTDPEKARLLIEDAVAESRRIEGNDAARPRALLAVARALLDVDHDRAWDIAFEAVNAANSADDFTGEDGELNLRFTVNRFNAASSQPAPDFDVAPIFSVLAAEDYNRAVALARVFQGEAPRAAAVIAIARALLNGSSATVKDH